MEKRFVLSLEELGFSLAICGYDEMAAGLLKTEYGELSEESWEMIFRTAYHGLLAKGLMLGLDEENRESCLQKEFKATLDHFVSTEKMVRCYAKLDEGDHILTIQKTRNSYLYHLSVNNVIHLIAPISKAEIAAGITDLYQPAFTEREHVLQADLTEDQLQLLSEAVRNGRGKQEIVDLVYRFNFQDKAINIFLHDTAEVNGSFANMSTVELNRDMHPTVTEIALFLFTRNRSWVVYNSKADKTEEPSIVLKTMDRDLWHDIALQYADSI